MKETVAVIVDLKQLGENLFQPGGLVEAEASFAVAQPGSGP